MPSFPSMHTEEHHKALPVQAAELRAAAVKAGADAPVPTCPGWDVRTLVRHLARVYAMVVQAMAAEPDSEHPRPQKAPEEFDEALLSLDERLTAVRHELSTTDPDRPVWAFYGNGTAHTWIRRMVHETAIHRLDAEHALAGTEHQLAFDPVLATDGIDEMLAVLQPVNRDWTTEQHSGRVLYHAADAERAWLVTYRPGRLPEVGVPQGAALGLDVDATVAGTADALYRKVWNRPSTAVVTGNAELAGIAQGR